MPFVWWLCAWNAIVPIRLVGMLLNPGRIPGYAGPAILNVVADQTSWAIATYVVFRVALQARHRPLRQVLVALALLVVPLMVLRYSSTYIVRTSARPNFGSLWYAGPMQLFPLLAVAALGLLIVYMQRERDNAVLQADLRAELAAARLQTLRLQLNPHFVFNALNSIASLILSDATKADSAVGALSAFLRASLSSNRGEETSLEDELKLVDAYLRIETLRFEWLSVDRDVPDHLRSACVPAFVLQLLVENAIRHGLAPRLEPGRVRISARLSHDRLTLSVSDDGVGIGARSGASLGIGLENVRARLAQLHGSEGRLTLEPSRPRGTVATIHIPYRTCSSPTALGAA